MTITYAENNRQFAPRKFSTLLISRTNSKVTIERTIAESNHINFVDTTLKHFDRNSTEH